MARYLYSLGEVGANDASRVGGKAASVGELARAGLPVPDGFCVSADAFRTFVASLGTTIESLARLGVTDAARIDAVRRRFLEAPVPGEVERAILEAANRLRAKATAGLAVRSSALEGEAGGLPSTYRQETLLGVRTHAQLIEAVKRCWASLYSERAIDFRRRQGSVGEGPAMGVLVQQLVDAEVAGVASSADPTSGERGVVLVEASLGLGEAVTSGLVTPDRYHLRKSDGALLDLRRGDKRLRISRAPDGGTMREPIDGPARRTPCLNAAELQRLAALALQVESRRGAPQELEFAFAQGELFLLEARAIPSLASATEWVDEAEAERPLRALPVALQEWLPQPLPPLAADLLRTTLFSPFKAGLVEEVEGLFTLNLSALRELLFPRLTEPELVELARSGDAPALSQAKPRALLSLLVHLWRGGWMRELRALLRGDAGAPLQAGHGAGDLGNANDEELLQALPPAADHPLSPLLRRRAPLGLALVPLGERLCRALHHVVRSWAEEPDAAATLLGGMPSHASDHIAQSLWELSRQVRADAALATVFRSTRPTDLWAALEQQAEAADWVAAFRSFLTDHGHRSVGELDISRPRWREEPAFALSVIRALAEAPEGRDPALRLTRASRARDEMERRIRARLSRGIEALFPLRRWLFNRLLALCRRFIALREELNLQLADAMDHLHQVSMEIGRRLVARKVSAHESDVFFLRLPEARQALFGGVGNMARVVTERRKTHKRQGMRKLPLLLDARGRALRLDAPETATGKVLRGTGASGGMAQGRAQRLTDPSQAVEIEPGAVLLLSSADPAWTALLSAAEAVVLERGGWTSPASVAARQLGIPAVVATGSTARLSDGDLLEVDGSAGTVTVVDSAEESA